jgi:hypothetical protein
MKNGEYEVDSEEPNFHGQLDDNAIIELLRAMEEIDFRTPSEIVSYPDKLGYQEGKLTSPVTIEEQQALVKAYIKRAMQQGVVLRITRESFPIDRLVPLHLELEEDQLKKLEKIYDIVRMPPIMVEYINCKRGAWGHIKDGNHRTFIGRFRKSYDEMEAYVIYAGVRQNWKSTTVGLLYEQLTEGDFKLL